MKKDNFNTLIVVVVVCLICVGVFLLLNHKTNYQKMEIVNDYDTFFYISSYATDYINYVSNNDIDKINYLLYDLDDIDNSYLISNNFSGDITYDIYDIYYLKMGNNYIYYIKGNIVLHEFGTTNSNVLDDDYRIVLIIDNKNNAYGVYPVNEDNYKSVINNISTTNIDSNQYNHLKEMTSVDKEKICVLYFSDYMDKLLNNIDNAYEILDDGMKKRYSDINSFKKYVNDNRNLLSYNVNLCSTNEYDDGRIYSVVDKNDNVFNFYEDTIMNYKVNFHLKEE